MNSKEYKELLESYNEIYEQQIGVPLKKATDEEAAKELGKMIQRQGLGSPKDVVTPKSKLQNASYELEGETIEEKKIATETGKKVMPSAKERSELAKKARAGKDIGKKGKGFEEVAAKAAKHYGSKEAGERVAAAAMFKQQAKAHEEVETDLFDFILEHLISEGYADTNEAALAIMANMSEAWKKSILES